MALFNELKRRNVFRIGAAYVVGSWLLIQVAETIFPLFGFGDGPARLVVIVLAIGFIPALVLTWIFELTPEGLKRDSDVDHGTDTAIRSARRLDRLIMLGLVLALGYFTFDKFVLSPQRTAQQEIETTAALEEARQEGRSEALTESFGEQSIAVLPFVNMSDDASNEYFADGISEELLNLLARVPNLRVISRSSAFAFKGKDLNLPDVARQLNVVHILEGSVRKAGDQVRITAQLIEARSDTHLWSETYDRTLDDIFAIQDEVAAEVVSQLKIKLLGDVPHAREVNTQAYTLYLQARQMSLVQSDDNERIRELLEQALEIEPDYVDALLLLGFVVEDDDFRDMVEERVLSIDPDNAKLKSLLALDDYFSGGDIETAARLLEEAAETDPYDSDVLFRSARLANTAGKTDLAIELAEYAARRDPLFFWAHTNLGTYNFNAGRIEEALENFQVAESLNNEAGAIQWKTGLALLVSGQPEAALEYFKREPQPIYQHHGTTLAFKDLGRDQESADWMAEMHEGRSEDWPFGMARAYAWLGNADQAFHFLEITWVRRPTWMGGLATMPLFRKLHDDPRWQPFLEKVRQTPEQIAAFKFDVRAPD